MTRAQTLVILALTISLCGVLCGTFIGGFAETYGFNDTVNNQSASFLDVSRGMSNNMNSIQGNLSNGTLVSGVSGISVAINTGWNAIKLITNIPAFYGSMIHSGMTYMPSPVAATIEVILIVIISTIVIFALLKAVFKVEL